MTYTAQFDATDEVEWNRLLGQFADATIYQTWAYGSARSGRRTHSHLVLHGNGEPVAMAQVTIARLPLLPWGMCCVEWGPAWRRRDTRPDLDHLRHALRALRQEYAIRRGLALKVVPNIVATDNPSQLNVFQTEGFGLLEVGGQTILMDLSPSIDDLRAGLRRKFRQILNKAEKAGIGIIEGTSSELFDAGLQVHQEMLERKQFAEFVDRAMFREVQRQLPEDMKMRILVCTQDGHPISCIAWSVVGDTGLPLLGATGRRALENGAGYFMWWKMCAWLKNRGYRYCDLAGINSARYPGGYLFKSGLGKTHGREVSWLGEFGCCRNPYSATIVGLTTWIKRLRALVKLRLERTRQSIARNARGSEIAPAAGPAGPEENSDGARTPAQQ